MRFIRDDLEERQSILIWKLNNQTESQMYVWLQPHIQMKLFTEMEPLASIYHSLDNSDRGIFI